jgi:hypothetical protein
MNQHGESPSRETEIELRLRKARPRPPQLDIAAIERLAREPVIDDLVEKSAAAVSRPASGQRDRWLGRRVAEVAASWAGGAIVGALVTVVLLNRAEPDSPSTDAVEPAGRRTPAPATSDSAATAIAKQARLDPDAIALAMLLDRWRSEGSAYWQEGPTLTARMPLHDPAVVSLRRGQESGARPPADEPRPTKERWGGMSPYPDPRPPDSRQQLLRDLLETSGSVL